ncbi:MAG: site-2 protease family protein [Clostridia bacterium]|nr:site-2 protease family protein [Clostridia bacterium]
MISLVCATVAGALSTIGYVLIALLILMFMITIHELGHYLFGKLFKFKINEFSIGMGPKIFQKKLKSGELFSIRIIPLGGYCAFDGEDSEGVNEAKARGDNRNQAESAGESERNGDASTRSLTGSEADEGLQAAQSSDNISADARNQSDGRFDMIRDEESESQGDQGKTREGVPNLKFNDHKPYERIIVLFAGAFFNFVSAIIIAFIAFLCIGNYAPTVVYVQSDSPNFQSGAILKGDMIYKVDGKTIYFFSDASKYLSQAEGEIELVVYRDGEYVTIYVEKGEYNPDSLLYTEDEDGNQYLELDENGNVTVLEYKSEPTADGLGIIFNAQKLEFGVGRAAIWSVGYCVRAGGYILESFGDLITGQVAISEVGGPIALISATTQVARQGLQNTLFLIILISVNLAVFNLLPIPALDGCRIIFVIIEWVRGKPVNRKVEAIIHTVGLIVLFTLVIGIDLFNLIF